MKYIWFLSLAFSMFAQGFTAPLLSHAVSQVVAMRARNGGAPMPIEQLIARLDHANFRVRERAGAEIRRRLVSKNDQAATIAALEARQAAGGLSPELQSRLAPLLRLFDISPAALAEMVHRIRRAAADSPVVMRTGRAAFALQRAISGDREILEIERDRPLMYTRYSGLIGELNLKMPAVGSPGRVEIMNRIEQLQRECNQEVEAFRARTLNRLLAILTAQGGKWINPPVVRGTDLAGLVKIGGHLYQLSFGVSHFEMLPREFGPTGNLRSPTVTVGRERYIEDAQVVRLGGIPKDIPELRFGFEGVRLEPTLAPNGDLVWQGVSTWSQGLAATAVSHLLAAFPAERERLDTATADLVKTDVEDRVFPIHP